MKNIIFSLFFVLCLSVLDVQAQNPAYPYGISFKALALDYQSQNGGSLDELKDYNFGFEIGFHKHLQENLNLVIPLKVGVVDSNEGSETVSVRRTIIGLDAQIQYQFYKPESKLIPYFFGGLGGVSESSGGEFNLQAPIGFGINFKVKENAFINWQSEYRYSFSDNRNNLHHGLGFVYLFGKKMSDEEEKVEKEEEKDMSDSDGDGIVNDLDLCPNLPGTKELNGCPDSDGDGIADFQDLCPDLAGLESLKGCPDSDGDGISDYDDDCPNMAGVLSNKGCPEEKMDVDSDGDGITDDLDECPNLAGTVDNNGCPDDDGDDDGIKDDRDKCPNEAGPASTGGCPDTDNDGVADFEDKCKDAPGLKIYNGCPDTDGDGIDDSRDKCPNSPGTVATGGCPEIKKEDKETLDIAMRAVEFETGKASLKAESFKILNQITNILARYPDYNLSISGHTDNTGSVIANQSLSERRAKACYDYFITQNIAPDRMNYAGYGESRPIADNNTLRGRSLNRRVEFNLIPR